MNEIEKLLFAYETDVRFPDVSGMEHLDMLISRSRLANLPDMTMEQQRRLAEADKMLLAQAHEFYQAIAQVADLSEWRKQENAPFSHWWWYFDVVVHLPVSFYPRPFERGLTGLAERGERY